MEQLFGKNKYVKQCFEGFTSLFKGMKFLEKNTSN